MGVDQQVWEGAFDEDPVEGGRSFGARRLETNSKEVNDLREDYHGQVNSVMGV